MPCRPLFFFLTSPRASGSTHPSIDTNEGDLEEELVKVGEDVPLDGGDVGEEGVEEEGGQGGEGHCQEGQQAGEHSTHLHLG